jgi:hypothetical protein
MAYEGARGGDRTSGDRTFAPSLVLLFGCALLGTILSLGAALVLRSDLPDAIAAVSLMILGITVLRAEVILEQRSRS